MEKTEAFVFDIMQPIVIGYDKVSSLIASALEGGSNYWYSIVRKNKKHESDRFMHDIVLNGGSLIITDQDPNDSEGAEYTLDYAAVRRGVERLLKMRTKDGKRMHRQALNLIGDNADAETADCFLQLALFGEVMYG